MKKGLFAIIFLFVLLVLPLQVYAAGPKEIIEKQVSKVLDTLRDPAVKSLSDEAKKEKVRPLITEVFDWEELSRRTLGRDWKKFNAAQQKEFMALFSALLEGVYLDRIIAYTDEKVVFGNESMLKKDRAEVQSKIITKSNTEIPLFYRMVEQNGKWLVYDVIIEGVSMIKNYRSQFSDILAKQSPEDLLKILREKTGKA